MPTKESIYRQFQNPDGFWGSLAGYIMAHRPSNIARNNWTLELLNIQKSDNVLEVGFGPGIALAKSVEKAVDGIVFGIDHSNTMCKQAYRRNRIALDREKLSLKVGTPKDLVGFCNSIDKVYSANVVQFWQKPTREFGYIREVMNAGGTIATTYLPRHAGATSADTRIFEERTTSALSDAGFSCIDSQYKRFSNLDAVCILAKASRL